MTRGGAPDPSLRLQILYSACGYAQDDKSDYAQDDKSGYVQDDKSGYVRDDKSGCVQDDIKDESMS